MYDHREMKYKQKIKDNFNFIFLCKKRDITFTGDGEDFLCSPFKTAPNVFCSHEIQSSSSFPFILAWKRAILFSCFPLRNLDFEKLYGHNFLDFYLFFLDFDQQNCNYIEDVLMSQRSLYFLFLTTPKTVVIHKTDVLFLNFHKNLNIRQTNLNSLCPYKYEEKTKMCYENKF